LHAGQSRRTFLDPVLRPIESRLYRWLGVRPEQEMSAGVYSVCFLCFDAGCAIVLFLVLMIQRWLPGGPADAYLATPMTVLAGALSFFPALALGPIAESFQH